METGGRHNRGEAELSYGELTRCRGEGRRFQIMCKGPVVRGNGSFKRWRAGHCAHCIWHREQQMMGPEMGSRHTGLCRSGVGGDTFPKSVIKSDLLLGKIF